MKKYFKYLIPTIALSLLALQVFAFADPQVAYEEFKAGKAILIDVREKEEIDQGVVQGAKWFPLSQIEANSARTADQIKSLVGEQKLYVYCRSGRRSATALEKLASFGVKGENLGGYDALIKAGLPSGKLP